ncbi:SDR family oxidoreductase [Gammaproteobacteria bacterium]|mgnify:FL=1|nr:SDR family oxidoreductase [Gammaproteobacteria bacterium]
MIESEKKVILITGACGQLGSELCRTYADLGWTVYITDIDSVACDKLAQSLSQDLNQKHLYFPMDITSEESVASAISHIEDQQITIDALVNNAGTAVFSDFTERTKDEFMKVLEVNLFGTFNCINQVGKHMVSNNISGAIINIGSIYGVVSSDPEIYTDCPRNNSEVYSASKAGIIQMTKYFAVHLAESNIRVNCVSPGGIFNDQGDDFVKNYSQRTPAKRMAIPQEIVQAIVYLSDNSTASYISGQNLLVDGGLTSW